MDIKNLKRKKFSTVLKANVPSIKDYNTYRTNLLLIELGLFPIPENVHAIIEDNKYLNIQIKDSDDSKHLLFQFPLEYNDLSDLEARSDYQELLNRYHLYINDYIDEVKKYAMLERLYLQQRFPKLVFNIKIRIKSFDSYINKLNENLSKGKDLYINDIMAERIIISEYDNSTDETILQNMCEQVAKALYDFRIETNFRMKKEVEANNANSEKEYITKDYIKNPKENGYQSIHILMENKNNRDFTYETQIRTLEMESTSKTSGEIAHNKYKPRLLNDLSPNRVPLYSEISCFNDESGNPIIVDVPLDNRFYHFYNSEKTDHSNLTEKNNPITYSKFRKEQYELEELLGITFKELRQKLQKISSKNEQKEEVR